MPKPIDPKDFQNLCEMSIDSMYELAALGELLEQKGLVTRQEIITLATDLKQKASLPSPTDPSSQPFTTQENAVIEELLDVIVQPWHYDTYLDSQHPSADRTLFPAATLFF